MAHKAKIDEDQSFEEREPSSKTDVEVDRELESKPFITEFDVVSDFNAAYKTKIFGRKPRKLDLTYSRGWSKMHTLVVLVIWGLSIAVLVLMYNNHQAYGLDRTLINTFIVWLVLYCLTGLVMSCCSLYFVRLYFANLQRPIFLLLLVRLLALLECILILFAGNAIIKVAFQKPKVEDSLKKEMEIHEAEAITRPITFSTTVTTILCLFLLYAMMIDCCTVMLTWLLHWWIESFNCKLLAIFQPGKPLGNCATILCNGHISEWAFVFVVGLCTLIVEAIILTG